MHDSEVVYLHALVGGPCDGEVVPSQQKYLTLKAPGGHWYVADEDSGFRGQSLNELENIEVLTADGMLEFTPKTERVRMIYDPSRKGF